MSKQLTVRLPEELVAYIDEQVKAGHAASRADLIASAVDRDRRRRIAERDVEILVGSSARDDLDELAAWAARTTLDLD